MAETPDRSTLVGRQVGNYKATAMIGRGSMGEVYKAKHPILDREVAIKVLSEDLSAYPELVSRFRREARAIAHIKHPAIVQAFDFGALEDGRCYYVMEFLQGAPLSAHIHGRGQLTTAETAEIALPLMEGLGAAHEAGFIHRDIKPDNIYIIKTEEGRYFPKIIDFGIAKLKNPDEAGDSVVTRIDAVMGTPLYMSPEQAPGASESVGPCSDIYSLAATLFHVLTGKPPFYSDNPLELMLMHAWSPIPSLTDVRPGLPQAISDVICKGLAKKPADRYPSMLAFADALRAALLVGDGAPATETPAVPVATVAPPVSAMAATALPVDVVRSPVPPAAAPVIPTPVPLAPTPAPTPAAPALPPPTLEELAGEPAREVRMEAAPPNATFFERPPRAFPVGLVAGLVGLLVLALVAIIYLAMR